MGKVNGGQGGNNAALWILGAVLALAAALRFHDINYSLWEDEFLTQLRANRSLSEIWSIYSKPAYYTAVWYASVLGDSEGVLRLPSVIFGLLTVALIFAVGRAAWGPGAGLSAALLLAVSAYHLRYSQEARYYALLMLCMLLALWFLHRALTRGRFLNWAGFTAAAAIGMRTHLFAMLCLAGLAAGAGAWVLLSRMEGGWRRRATVLALIAFCLILADGGAHGPRVLAVAGIDLGAQSAPLLTEEADAPANTREMFRLQPGEYFSFYQAYFPHPLWLGIILLALGAFGLAVIFSRSSSLGAMLAGATLLPPLPFFFINVNHFFHDRYFSFQMVYGVLMIAVGGAALAQFSSGWLEGRLRGKFPGFARPAWIWRGATDRELLSAAIAFALFVSYAPWAGAAISKQFDSRPARDFKGLASFMGQTLQPGDGIYFIGQEYRLWFPLQLALARELPDFSNQQHWLARNRGAGTASAAEIAAFAARFPERNMWFLSRSQDAGDAGERLANLGADSRHFGQLLVWVFGAPSRNLVHHGGMEGLQPEQVDRPGITLTDSREAYAGDRALRLHRGEPGDLQVSFALGAEIYPLRNSDFLLWNEKGPVGWEAYPTEGAAQTREGLEGGPVLSLKAGDLPSIIRQKIPLGLAPGNTVEVRALGHASAPQALALALEYEAGGERFREETFHAGDGQWSAMVLRTTFPAQADPASITVELASHPAADNASVLATNVALALDPPPMQLDPLKAYTVSLMMKYEAVRWAGDFKSADPPNSAQIVLVYREPGKDRDQALHLARFSGSSPWRPFVFTVKPGENLPHGASNIRLVVSIYNGTGTLWIDNVQVEAGDVATPFTATHRPPHDERFALEANQGA